MRQLYRPGAAVPAQGTSAVGAVVLVRQEWDEGLRLAAGSAMLD